MWQEEANNLKGYNTQPLSSPKNKSIMLKIKLMMKKYALILHLRGHGKCQTYLKG